MAPRVALSVVLLATLTVALPAIAEEPGEKELYKAIGQRLETRTLFHLGQVIAHCEKALELGLKGDQKTFCEKLLVASLVERANQLAQHKLTKDRRKLVIDDLKQAIKIDAAATDAYLAVARLQAVAGETEAAVDALTKAIDIEKKLGDKADEGLAVQALLFRAALTDDPKRKLADFNEALRFNPESSEVLRSRGQILIAQGKFKEALADFQAAIKVEPTNAQSHAQAGLALMALNNLEEALKSFTTAIELEPRELPAAYVYRARIYLRQGKPQDGLNDLNKALSIARPTGELLMLRAGAYHALKNDERALKDAENALRIDPDDVDVILQVGLLYYQLKKNEKAIETFTQAIEKDSKNASAYAGRGDAYLQVGEHRKAIEDYREALKHDEENTHVLNNLAWVLSTSPEESVRNGREAIELAKKACELTEYKEAHIVSTLAAGYAETGDFASAIRWSKKAVELGEGEVVDQLKKELASYEAKKPWREKFGEEKE